MPANCPKSKISGSMYLVDSSKLHSVCMNKMFKALATVAKSKPVLLVTWEFF